ncbi:MAG: response regulator [Lachnospiraceae bacterium]|nr:response regulator [Lachnospiraceae bacterium]
MDQKASRVLIVDDMHVNRMILSSLLAVSGVASDQADSAEASATEKIPVIFLTGENERDHVVKILKQKPDGYLLKTSQKDSLVDAIGRFFSESLFRESLNET